MLTPLTKSIKTKPIPFIFFPKFFLFILIFLDFILDNDEINVLWKRRKMVDERGRDKNQICKLWKMGGK
jgi:hypothetical protein